MNLLKRYEATSIQNILQRRRIIRKSMARYKSIAGHRKLTTTLRNEPSIGLRLVRSFFGLAPQCASILYDEYHAVQSIALKTVTVDSIV